MKDYAEKRNGGWYVSGTRVSLDSIVDAFRDGASPESILEEFDTLSLEQIYGAITFYLANQSVVDDDLRERRSQVQDLKRRAAPLPRELRDRLEAARSLLHTPKQD